MTKSDLLGGSHSPRPRETGRKGASVCITGNTLTCILHHLYHKLTPIYTIYEHSHTIYTIHMTISHLSHTSHISSHVTPLPPWWGPLSHPKARGGWGLDRLTQAGSQGLKQSLLQTHSPPHRRLHSAPTLSPSRGSHQETASLPPRPRIQRHRSGGPAPEGWRRGCLSCGQPSQDAQGRQAETSLRRGQQATRVSPTSLSRISLARSLMSCEGLKCSGSSSSCSAKACRTAHAQGQRVSCQVWAQMPTPPPLAGTPRRLSCCAF